MSHPTTLEWETLGLVRPEMATIINSPTRVFTERDVDFGRKLIGVLRSRPGEISVEQASRIARAR